MYSNGARSNFSRSNVVAIPMGGPTNDDDRDQTGATSSFPSLAVIASWLAVNATILTCAVAYLPQYATMLATGIAVLGLITVLINLRLSMDSVTRDELRVTRDELRVTRDELREAIQASDEKTEDGFRELKNLINNINNNINNNNWP
jgi:hypothetical protein